MNTERVFEDLGIDAITGVEIMDQLSIVPDELQSPRRFAQLKEVINYLKQFPQDTQRFLINKATRGKLVDKLQHLHEYTHLLTRKSFYEQELEKLSKERSAVEQAGDPILLKDIATRDMANREQLNFIQEEIGIYEK